MGSPCRVGIDIGGTFTDFTLVRGNEVFIDKVASTPPDFDRAILEELPRWIASLGIQPADLSEFIHGTTAPENIVLEGTGARVGLITTRGFEDVLEIGRTRNPRPYDLRWRKRPPLVPRELRQGVAERIDGQGQVVAPLDPASVDLALRRLREASVEAIAVCLLNSYRNPVHERRVAELALDLGVPVSISTEINAEYKEFERTSTTVVDAYVKPAMTAYVRRLADGLQRLGFTAPLRIVQANGAITTAAFVIRRPIVIVGSGPAAGVSAAAWAGREMRIPNVLAFDMGGTTAKASAIADHQISRQVEYEIGGETTGSLRLTRGGLGYLVRVPAIEVVEVGAGGGSIARVEAGILRVGPRSAGSVPGPICYRRGGKSVTVTDANAVLGYYPEGGLLGGRLALDVDGARRALHDQIAVPLGLSDEEAAFGIHEIANAEMERALAAVTYEVGRDAAEFTLMAYGGAGPVHAVALAHELGVKRVIVPPRSGVFSAVGMLVGRLEYEHVQSVLVEIEQVDRNWLEGIVAEASTDVMRLAAEDGYGPDSVTGVHVAEVRYRGENASLFLELKGNEDPAEVVERFSALHERKYGFRTAERVQLVSLRTVIRVKASEERTLPSAPTAARRMGGATTRRTYFGRKAGWCDAAILARADLSGQFTPGPVVIEDYDTTIVIGPYAKARIDEYGDVDIEVEAAE